jgi:microcystin-dependent protein
MNLPPVLRQRYFDSNGDPLAGGKLYTYQSGTTTPQATYTDSGGLTANANPLILDSSGYATMWLNPALSYKFVLKDSNDVTQWTTDNVIGLLTNDAVGTNSLQDGSVTTAKIADDAVTADKLKDSVGTDADRAVTTNHIRDSAITLAKVAAAVQAFLVPSGSIVAYGSNTAPTGWLACDGSSVLRADYPALFAAIGTGYGAADGTHFNVPDFRGRFLRGVDGTAGRDPDKLTRTAMNTGGNTGNLPGSVQTDAFQGHFHGFNSYNTGKYGNGGNPGIQTNIAADNQGTFSVGGATNNGTHGVPRETYETRPLNAYVAYIIKT